MFKRQESLPIRNRKLLPLSSSEEEMDHDYFHWRATAEVMDIIRRLEKSLETKRLVERRLEIEIRPETMRRRHDHSAQRTIWVQSRSNKRSREEIAEIDGELIQRANGFREATNQSKQWKKNQPKFHWRNNPHKNNLKTRRTKGRARSLAKTICHL